MMNTEEQSLQKTDLRSLWSDTLMDMLYESIEANWSANATREILFELQRKGYKLTKVMRKVDNKFGKQACAKLLEKIKK